MSWIFEIVGLVFAVYFDVVITVVVSVVIVWFWWGVRGGFR